jgi:uncharacterized protein YjbI with pentapeptide repeats
MGAARSPMPAPRTSSALRPRGRTGPAWPIALVVGLTLLTLLTAQHATAAPRARAAAAPTVAPPEPRCPTSTSNAPVRDFSGKRWSDVNFSNQDLTNANFSNATFERVAFQRANLTGANFTGAKFVDGSGGQTVRTTDFSFATLDRACFQGAQFAATTYFTYASLSCADFSQTDLSGGRAIFGADPLRLGTDTTCRSRFRQAVLNCEFIDQWKLLDLTGATIGACAALLQTASGQAGRDFAGALMAGVRFEGIDLSRSTWAGADLAGASFQEATLDGASKFTGDLSRAAFNRASLKGIDLSNAKLYGANFTQANLENANLQSAFLQANPTGVPPVPTAADFTGAHLKNVNLSGAQLQAAVFTYASLYSGSQGFLQPMPPDTCATIANSCTTSWTGSTCNCSTLKGANLTQTKFTQALVYGVDFTGAGSNATQINGTDFSGAVLVGSNFTGAQWSIDPAQGGAVPILTGAYLQGVKMADAKVDGAVLTGAFVDFGSPGNTSTGNRLFVKLGAAFTSFRGWTGAPAAGACVSLKYYTGFTLPATVGMTCPNGVYRDGGCGVLDPTRLDQSPWRSPSGAGSANPPGFYESAATFEKADPQNNVCNGNTLTLSW